MALVQIFKAQDNVIKFTIFNSDESPVDLNDVPGIVIYINDERRNLIHKFSKVSKTGYGDILETNPVGGQMEIKLEASKTKAVNGEGVITSEVKLEKNDLGFENDVKHSVSFIKDIAQLVNSLTEDEEDLQTPVP